MQPSLIHATQALRATGGAYLYFSILFRWFAADTDYSTVGNCVDSVCFVVVLFFVGLLVNYVLRCLCKNLQGVKNE